MSEENDKLSKSPVNPGENARVHNDKKRFVSDSKQKVENEPEKELERKIAAEKKARQLEKRLAALSASKKADQGNPGTANTNSGNGDKKPIAHSGETDSSGEDKTVYKPVDKTVFKPKVKESEDKTVFKPNVKEPEDKTVFKPKAKNPEDKTVFKPKAKEPVDKTVFKPKVKESVDKTVFKPKTNESIDKTVFKPKAKEPVDKTVFKAKAAEPQDKTVMKPIEARRNTPEDPESDEFLEANYEDETGIDVVDQQVDDDELAAPTMVNPNSSESRGRGEEKDPFLSEEIEGVIKGRFVYEKVLGAGGMGVVYKAKDLLKVEAQDRDPYVAIKVLGDEFRAHPEAFIALQRESRKTQRIAHPNIVNVHDFDRDGDTVFMTMEFLDGRPLDQFISQYKSTGLPEEDAWKILEGVSAALIYAHEQEIIHSDFKPGNIFVTKQGLAKVFDFGIARAVAKAEIIEESIDDKTVFDAGNLGALTPAYASLEMLEGEAPDIRDDIYALGCIAYEMFTGNHPFNRMHANEAMRKKMKPKRISNISKRQWRAIEKALAYKREDRIESVAEFWQQMTTKRGAGVWFLGVAALLVAVVAGLSYQVLMTPLESGFSEDQIRSEIEREVLIDQNKGAVESLLASPEFSNPWEDSLYQSYKTLQDLLGEEDPWLTDKTLKISQAYVEKINALITSESFPRAKELLDNLSRYSNDPAIFVELLGGIQNGEALAQQRLEETEKQQAAALQERQVRAEKTRIQKEKDTDFDVAMETVDRQLQCRSTMNMRDIDIAVSKLRTLNPGRYRKAEADIIAKLSLCIGKIGQSFPERAEEFKKRALRIFPNNAIIANIKIEPKDPCDDALAGLGARGNRAICRDKLKDESKDYGKGPALVVIPAKGSVDTFAIGKYEITIEDLNRFCDASGECKSDTSNNIKYPATNVSANTIQKYLRWLSVKSKRRYRLPTKSEWVYAARANSAKVDSNRNCRLESRGIKKGGVLIKASTGQQNPWGLINHLGNARELVSKGNSYLVMGGSYDTVIEECVVTKEESHSGAADANTGFRVFREIESK